MQILTAETLWPVQQLSVQQKHARFEAREGISLLKAISVSNITNLLPVSFQIVPDGQKADNGTIEQAVCETHVFWYDVAPCRSMCEQR